MIIFFNDTFIVDEFYNHDSVFFKTAVSRFVEFSKVLNHKRATTGLRIYFKTHSKVKGIFKEIDTDLADLVLTHFNVLGVKFWDESSLQDNEYNYFLFDVSSAPPNSIPIKGETLAEAAEVRRKGTAVLALNVPDLKFSKWNSILVHIIPAADSKNVESLQVDCADCGESLELWIDRNSNNDFKYLDTTRPPLDKETCLVNKFKFSPITGLRQQGRQVYRDSSLNYWYVDNLHTGNSAHIEVFSRTKAHIGEADIFGKINYSKVDVNKSLDI